MAAGLGFKDFVTGEVLTAADVDGYLMQGIWVFASAAARDAAVTSPQEGNFAFTKDTNGLWYYDGAAWVASGATGDIEGVTAGTGISGGGTSGTVTITNSMATAIDAKGDLVVGTGADTFSRLAVGTNGYILTADSAEATGIKWAAAAGGGSGLTLIKRSTFSNVAGTSTTFDGVFSSTYKSYLVVLEYVHGASAGDDLQLQGIYSGTTATANYVGSSGYATYNSASFGNIQNNVTAQFTMTQNVGVNQGAAVSGQLFFTNVGNSTTNGRVIGQLYDGQADNNHFAGCALESRLYTGFLLKSSSSNITGAVAVYGLAAA